MKRGLPTVAVLTGCAVVFAGCASSRGVSKQAEIAHVTLTEKVIVRDVMRFGVNVGTWTSWGAEQLAANVVMNPGFEGLLDRAIVIVGHAGPGRFTDDSAWLARPDGFWEHARYDVRTGHTAGQTGEIERSRSRDSSGLPDFVTAPGGPELQPGDVVALTKTSDDELPADWWFSEVPGARYSPERGQRRPGSAGGRCLRIAAASAPAEVTSYVDAIGDRAGTCHQTMRHSQSGWSS